MQHTEFKIYEEIHTRNTYGLSVYFDGNIEIHSRYWGEKIVNGSKDAIVFFEEFFAEYNARTTGPTLIFCRLIDEYGCTPVLDEQFKEFCPTHDFFIYLRDGKIMKIDIFPSLDLSMRFYQNHYLD